MARTDTLDNFLIDVAAAIKTKKRDSADIPAPNFDTEIINLSDGSEIIKGLAERTVQSGVLLDNDTEHIRSHAFWGCENLSLATLPPNLISIGEFAFYGCSRLKVTEIPAGVLSIGTMAFANAFDISVETLIFKGTPKAIASDAFSEIMVPEIIVPWAKDAIPGEPWGAVYSTIKHPETTT